MTVTTVLSGASVLSLL